MKYLKSVLAVLFFVTSAMASAAPSMEINTTDVNASALIATATEGIAEPSLVDEGVDEVRKIAYVSPDRVTSKAGTNPSTAPHAAENLPAIARETKIPELNVSYDRRDSTHSPMTDPETWLLLVLGIAFVALQSGRRGSTVSASKLQ